MLENIKCGNVLPRSDGAANYSVANPNQSDPKVSISKWETENFGRLC